MDQLLRTTFSFAIFCRQNKNLEFDFMDEVAAPTMRVRGLISTPKPTMKKKTANFASVLDAMKKNKRTLQTSKEQ